MKDHGYRQILYSMPIGYVLCKMLMNEEGLPCDFEFIQANDSFEEATGLKVSKIIGKSLFQVMPGIRNYSPDWIRLFSDIALNGQNKIFEQYSHELKKWLSINSYSPEKGYFVALVTDITKEKEHILSLSDSNRLLTDFLNSSSDLIYLKDDRFRHLFANEALAVFLGRTQQDIIGKDDFALYPGAMAENCRATDEAVMQARCKILSEETVSGKTFETVKFPVSYPSGAVGIGAFIKDITDRKMQEENLERQLSRQSILADVFMKNFESRQELLDYTLLRSLELTGSEYGYTCLYDEQSREFTPSSLTFSVNADCGIIDEELKYQLDSTGIWEEVIRQKKPVVFNDIIGAELHSNGFSKMYVGLKNAMAIPIITDTRIVAVVGVGNKAAPYTDIDVNEMKILAQSAWLAVEKRTAQMLTLAEREKYESILNELPALICESLPDSTLTFVNREYCLYFEKTFEEIIGRKFLDFVPEKDREELSRPHFDLSPQNKTGDFEFSTDMNGKKRWQRWRNIGVFDEQGQPLRYYSIGVDISERKALSDERERLLAQMDAMFSEHEAVMLLVEPESGKIIDSNPSASLFYGYSREELLNMYIHEINQLPRNEIAVHRMKIMNREQKQFTCPHKLKNGQIRSVDVYSSPISYNDKTALFSIVIDVTEREEAFREIVHINYHDYLTGIYNRRFFEEEFDRLNTADNFPITVLMGDINGLKLINDSLGHHVGDNVIKDAAGKIAKNLRSDDIFARIGGDEFGVILLKTDEAAANSIVKRIKCSIECDADGTEAENRLLSISFGFAVQEAACVSLGVLMKEAEGYLYNKKYYDSRSLKSKAVNIIMNTLFEKSPRDKMHSERVGNISALIAESLGIEKERVDKIRVAGWLHDIGKIGIPEYVLNKESGLDEEEWAIMKTHPEKGWRILENTHEFYEICDIVLYHHEKWDGSGYPLGLRGDEIPLETRIISVADAYDAMAYNRSYREKVKPTEAIKELRRCSGTHFDPKIIEVFVKYVLKNEKDIFSKNASEPII
ncbi:MAG: PAS domain S-box protein [Oscillospiraceae bacterium]